MTTNLSMPIYNRLKILIAQKEFKEGRKLTYRTISKETGISTSTLTAFVTQQINRYDSDTLEKLCRYFDCQPGDVLVYEVNALARPD